MSVAILGGLQMTLALQTTFKRILKTCYFDLSDLKEHVVLHL